MAGNDINALLLLHLDGNDQSNTITDSSQVPHTVTTVGDAQIDTAQSKFGGASGLFDGTGDYLNSPDNADWQVLPNTTNDSFTIDFHVRFASLASNPGLLGQFVDNSNYWGVYHNGSSLIVSGADAGVLGYEILGTWAPSLNTWYHVAIVHSAPASNFIFIDGNTITLTSDDNKNSPDIAAELKIGFYERLNQSLNGWLDEVRFSDIARWTSSFVPPTAAYTAPHVGDFANDLPLLNVQAAGAPGAELTFPALSVSAQTAPGAALTFPILSLSANDVPPASASISFPSLSVVAGYDAAVAITFPSLSVSAEQKFKGNIAITLPALSLTATALQGSADGTTLTLPAFTISIRTGLTVSTLLPQLAIAATGQVGAVGTYNKSLPRMTVNVKATQQSRGVNRVTLPVFTLDATLKTGEISLASTRDLPLLRLSATGFVGVPGNVDLTFPAFELATFGYQSINGTVVQSLKMLTLNAYADSYTNRII